MFALIYKYHLHTADVYNDTCDVADTTFVKFASPATVNSKKLGGEYTQHFL